MKRGKEIAAIGPDEEFGAMAALSDSPRAATAVAAEDLTCLAVPGEPFREFVRAEPELALHLARAFAQRLAGV
jgi:CRP-like cAMP-binding protein